MHQLTRDVFEQLENIAQTKGTLLRIKSSIQRSDGSGAVLVKADPQRINQVMTNLIENAIKYGKEKGKVVVGFETTKNTFPLPCAMMARESTRTSEPDF